MNIIVLAGGKSTEREVSIVTGTKVCEALRSAGHNAAVLDVYFGTKNTDVFGADYILFQTGQMQPALFHFLRFLHEVP